MLTSNVIAISTMAAYINTPSCVLLASGKFKASKAARVLAGEDNEMLNWFELPICIARTSAPKIPVDAVGRRTRKMTSQRVAPMPKAASRILGDTALKASREMADTVGRIMIVRTSAAGSRPGPLNEVLKNGSHPKYA